MTTIDGFIPDTGEVSWECYTGWHAECTDPQCWCESPFCPHGDLEWEGTDDRPGH